MEMSEGMGQGISNENIQEKPENGTSSKGDRTMNEEGSNGLGDASMATNVQQRFVGTAARNNGLNSAAN
jgi:hypothetical protein